MTLQEKLANLGLKNNEIKVFLAVLEVGEPAVGQVQKETGLHKQLIYHAAESLAAKGLLSIFEVRGRKRFSVPDPTIIEEQARQRLASTQDLVPELFKLSNQKRTEDKIRIYRNVKGVHQYYLDRIRKQATNSELRILGVNSERYSNIFNSDESAFRRFEQTRDEKKIVSRMILFGPKESEAALNRNRKLIDMRLINDAIQAPMDIMIWDTSIGMLFYGAEPYILDISGKDAVEGFGNYFEVLWKGGNKIDLS